MSQANAAGETVGVSVPEGVALEEGGLTGGGLTGGGLELGAGSAAGDGSLVAAGTAGMASMEVASALVSRALVSWALASSASASSMLAGVTVSVVPVVNSLSFTPLAATAPAGVSPVAAAPRTVRFDPLPLVGDGETASAWAGFLDVRRGAVVMIPAGWVSCVMLSSWSSSSPSAREVTMVGEAPPGPPDPLGPFVRLSKPSSI
jgi:hypothetical protein